jgi:3'-phosphoadenosine 5'-phosphosulfate (PAPS) 3'-phosphatase
MRLKPLGLRFPAKPDRPGQQCLVQGEGLRTWDTAAGVLLVSEAGGMVTDLAGKPYRVGGPDLLVSNTRIHAEMQIVARDIADRVGAGPG